jgi:hypothetical protein
VCAFCWLQNYNVYAKVTKTYFLDYLCQKHCCRSLMLPCRFSEYIWAMCCLMKGVEWEGALVLPKKVLSLWLHGHESSQELDWFFVQEQISNSQSCNTTIWAWFWRFVCACLFLVCYPLGLYVTDFWTVLILFLVIHYSSYRDWSSSVTFYRRCKKCFSHLSLLL